jgi:TP901 family phage tail tape measure protein
MVTEELLLVIKSNTGQAVSGINQVSSQAQRMAQDVGRQMSNVGQSLTMSLTVPIVGAGIAAGKLAMDFETGMAQIQALVGMGAEDMESLRAGALEMGRQYGIAATDAANGLFFLTSAGLSASDAVDTLAVVSQASAAGLGDMETLANGVTTVMTNFGLSAEDAMDKFIMAARKAKADPADLAKILNQNAANAAAVGMSFDDLAGVTAFLTTVTGDANRSGTGMGAMLAKMVKPSQMAVDALDSIGWSADEFRQRMAEDLPGALADLDAAFAGSDFGNGAWIGKVFEDQEAISAVNALLNQSVEDVQAFGDAVENSAGLTQEAWGIMSGTSAVKVKQAIEGIKSALIPLGDLLIETIAPHFQTVVDWVTNLTESFGDLDKKGKEQVLMFAGIAAAIGPALKILGPVVSALAAVNPVFLGIAAAVAGVIWWLKETGVTLEDVKAWFQTAAEYILDMFAPLMEWFQENSEDFKDLWSAATEHFMAIWEDIWAWLQPFLAEFTSFIETEVADTIKWFTDNWPAIRDTIMAIMLAIRLHWETVWPIIQAVVENVWAVIKVVVSSAIRWIQGVITAVTGIITGDWRQFLTGMSDIFGATWDLIKGLADAAVNSIANLIFGFMEGLTSQWGEEWQEILDTFMNIWDQMGGGVMGVVGIILEGVNTMVNGVIDGINGLIGKVNKLPGVNIGTIGNVRVGLADGGQAISSGMFRVGEQGPEEVFLPGGSVVRPLGPGTASGGSIVVNVHSEADPVEIGREVGWALIQRGAA